MNSPPELSQISSSQTLFPADVSGSQLHALANSIRGYLVSQETKKPSDKSLQMETVALA